MAQLNQKFPSLDPNQHDYTGAGTFSVFVAMSGEDELSLITEAARGTVHDIHTAIATLFPNWKEVSVVRNT